MYPSDSSQYIIVTHIHLDHAGGTSKLAKLCPNAKVLAHPRAAPHLIDPSRTYFALEPQAPQVVGRFAASLSLCRFCASVSISVRRSLVPKRVGEDLDEANHIHLQSILEDS